MPVKTFKPTTPSLRNTSVSDFAEITATKPCKKLLEPLPKKGGRNNHGHLTVRHRGGGHKRMYRVIDFKRNKLDIPAKVATIEYDPNRSSNIALLHYEDGEKRYIIAPRGLTVGDRVISSDKADILTGNCLPLGKIPTGVEIHNLELKPGKGGQIVRSAGNFAKIEAKEGAFALVKLPSGRKRLFHLTCKATIGQVGNSEHENIKIGKAGRKRWMGRRPKVRGVAMNPVDHPMGGGEGRSSGGRHPCSPWGQISKGYKTRKKNKQSDKYHVK